MDDIIGQLGTAGATRAVTEADSEGVDKSVTTVMVDGEKYEHINTGGRDKI